MTFQARDILILDGQSGHIMIGVSGIPRHARVLDTPEPEGGFFYSSACWRGYVATWKIDNERLYLSHIAGKYALDGDVPLFADWYSGTLGVVIGNLGEYREMTPETQLQRQRKIEIRSGEVIKLRFPEEPERITLRDF